MSSTMDDLMKFDFDSSSIAASLPKSASSTTKPTNTKATNDESEEPTSDPDSDFYSDEEPLASSAPKLIYKDASSSESESDTDTDTDTDTDNSSQSGSQSPSRPPKKKKKRKKNKNHRPETPVGLDPSDELTLNTVLATPRLDPTPYDPPGFEPGIDENRLLSSYRRIRDALIVERQRHAVTRDMIAHEQEQIDACKEFGVVKMAKVEMVRKKQDEMVLEWKALLKKEESKKKELHQDLAELSTELRNLKQQLEYEIALSEQEQRNVDKVEDEIVVKEMLLGQLMGDVGVKTRENYTLHAAGEKLQQALESTKDITDDGEERLALVSEELGLTEIDVFMLQRQVKVAEEEAKKWRHRYLMVEKDVRRSEKLLADFSKTKGAALPDGGGRGGFSTSVVRESVSGGGFGSSNRSLSSTTSLSLSSSVGDFGSNSLRAMRNGGDSLSGLARGFGGIDEKSKWVGSKGGGGRTATTNTVKNTDFLEAVLKERGTAASSSNGGGGGGRSQGGLRSSMFRNPSPLEQGLFGGTVGGGLIGGGGGGKAGAAGSKSGEVVEGMQINFHDTHHDISVNNNRRGTAKARSIGRKPALWPEALADA
jgi:hypothetical protein